jgi:hypothetical protein
MARGPSGKGEGTIPPSQPVTTPQNYNQPSHDFTLQVVVDMQKTLGALDAKVDRLISDVEGLDTKTSEMSHRFALVAGGAAFGGAIIGVIAFLIALAGWDRVFPSKDVPQAPATTAAVDDAADK